MNLLGWAVPLGGIPGLPPRRELEAEGRGELEMLKRWRRLRGKGTAACAALGCHLLATAHSRA